MPKPKESTMSALLRLTLLGTTLTLLAGCTTIRSIATTPVVDTSCGVFRPITYSASQDSPETVAEIRGHNAAYKAIC